jgi:hypothetical protein
MPRLERSRQHRWIDDGVLQHRVNRAVPNRLGLLDVGVLSRIAIACTGCDAVISTIGRDENTCFNSVAEPARRALPAWMIAMRWQCSARTGKCVVTSTGHA